MSKQTNVDALLRYLRERDWRRAQEDLLRAYRLHDPTAADFALTPRTQRLRANGTEGVDDPPCRPLVLALILPEPEPTQQKRVSFGTIQSWLSSRDRKYGPSEAPIIFPRVTLMHDGAIAEEQDCCDSKHLSRYVAVQRNGLIEMGLGRSCICREKDIAFLLTPTVAQLWSLLDFAIALYRDHFNECKFTLCVAFRQTQNAFLAAFAQGWREPWGGGGYRLHCPEPAFLIRHDDLASSGDSVDVQALIVEIASEIEAAWGFGGTDTFPRCFRPTQDGTRGEFDVGAGRL